MPTTGSIAICSIGRSGCSGSERPARRRRSCSSLLKSNVRAFEAHLYLGNAYLEQGRTTRRSANTTSPSQLNPVARDAAFRSGQGAVCEQRRHQRGGRAGAPAACELDPQSVLRPLHARRRPPEGGAVARGVRRLRPRGRAERRAIRAPGPTSPSGAAHSTVSRSARAQFEAMIALGYQVAPAHFNLGRDRGAQRRHGGGGAPVQARAPGRSDVQAGAGRAGKAKMSAMHDAAPRPRVRSSPRSGVGRLLAPSCGAASGRASVRPSSTGAASAAPPASARTSTSSSSRSTPRGGTASAPTATATRATPNLDRLAAGGRPLRAGDHQRAADAAGAFDALHRAAAAAARRPRQRRIRARSEAHHARAASLKKRGLADRRVRRRVRARREVGAQPGLRHLSSTSSTSRSTSRSRSATSRGARTRSSTTRCRGSSSTPTSSSSPGCTSTTRTRRTIRPSRSSRGSARTSTPARSPSSTQQVGRVLQWLDAARARRTDHRRRDRRPRREPERAPRRHARTLHLRRHHARAVHRPRAVRRRCSGRRVKSAVRSEDVMPTVLDLLGRAGSRTRCRDEPGAADDRRGYRSEPRRLFANRSTRATTTAGASCKRCAPGGSSSSPRRSRSCTTSSAIRASLTNLYDERRPLADRMAAELQRLRGRGARVATGPPAVDPETRERLAALGYIGSFNATPRKAGRVAAGPEGQDRHLQPDDVGAGGATARTAIEAAIARLRKGRRHGPEHPRRLGHAGQRVLPEARLPDGAGAIQARPAHQARLRPRDDQPRRRPTARSATTTRRSSATSSTCRRTRRTPGSAISWASCSWTSTSSTRRRPRSGRRWPTIRASRRRGTRSVWSR